MVLTPAVRPPVSLWLSCVIFFTLGALSAPLGAAQLKVLPPGDESIVVGQPKIFDERSLMFMWHDAQSRLAGLNFIDATSLSGAVGSLQGVRASARTFGFSLSVTPPAPPSSTPSTTTNTPPTTTNNPPNTSNNPSNTPPGTTINITNGAAPSSDTQQASQTPAPTAPSLPSPPSLPALPASLGLNASDLLAEQMDLTYQVMNLRFLLERAISDRLPVLSQEGTSPGRVPKEDVSTGVRPQAVVGFQISVAPDSHLYRNALAEVVLTVTNAPELALDINRQLDGQLARNRLYWSPVTGTETYNPNAALLSQAIAHPDAEKFHWKAPSLVALLPREKTYNVATMTQDASQYCQRRNESAQTAG